LRDNRRLAVGCDEIAIVDFEDVSEIAEFFLPAERIEHTPPFWRFSWQTILIVNRRSISQRMNSRF
jgi:hypothetical protein